MNRLSYVSAGKALFIAAAIGIALAATSQAQQTAKAYPQQFAGIWKAQSDGRDFLVLNLHEEAIQLAGTIRFATVHLTEDGDVDKISGDLNQPIKLENAQIKGSYLFFIAPKPDGATARWRMEITSPGRASLECESLAAGQYGKPIAIVRETIFGPVRAPTTIESGPIPADLRQFAGEWKTDYEGHAFLTLVLKEQAGKLVGACQHSRSINWDKHGELTIVSEELAEDEIVSATATGQTLSLVIGNSEDPEDPVKIALTLTGVNQAEGVLLGLPPDVPKQKPWTFKRTPNP